MNEDRKKLAKWYVVHTYSGHENKVKATLEKMVENRGFVDDIFEIVVPTESYYDKKAKQKHKTRKLFPGYVLVNMIVDDESWYIVRNTRGVTGFVGPSGKPIALSDKELKTLGMTDEIAKTPLDVKPGDSVLIVNGGMRNQHAKVLEVDQEARKLLVVVDMFNRDIKSHLDFDQVEKI